jgi:hypothetical protein
MPDNPVEVRRCHPFHPYPDRDVAELEVWLNSLPGRLVAAVTSPWDGGALLAFTVEDSPDGQDDQDQRGRPVDSGVFDDPVDRAIFRGDDPRITHPSGWTWFHYPDAITYIGDSICPRCGHTGDDARCSCIYYLKTGWRWTESDA